MAHLRYYEDEREQFKEAFGRKFENWKSLRIVFKKLLKHIGYSYCSLKYGRGSHASRWVVTIHDMDFGTLCHEIAHVVEYKKSNKATHKKQHRKIMRRLVRYCERKNWFESELQRRTAPKWVNWFEDSYAPVVRQEPSKQVIRAKEIIRIEKRMLDYQRKIRLLQKRLKKAQRSHAIRVAWQKRQFKKEGIPKTIFQTSETR